MLSTCDATFLVYTPIYRAAASLTISWWFTPAMYSRSIRIGGCVSLFVFPCRSVSLGTRNHRTRTPDNSGRSHDHSLIGAADRSSALRRNDSFAVITNHSRHGPLVVSQLRFSGPVPLNAVASMGQPTQLPLWASLLMLASRASSLCSIFLLVLRNWHSCLLEPRSFRFLLQLGGNNSFQVRTVQCKRIIRQ